MGTTGSTLRRLPHDRPLLALLVAVVAVELIGASGSIFTAQGMDGWYASLERPAIAPPSWVFGPVWTTLFVLIGAAVWLVWRQAAATPRKVRAALAVFAVHFAVNVGWSAAFFGRQNVGLGLGVILALLGLILVTIGAFARVDRRAAMLLVPYLLWVAFATYLNYQFWVLN